jgi:hypothetical protein
MFRARKRSFARAALLVAVLSGAGVAHADGRTDYLVRMLRTSSQYRVRIQAALTLGEIADSASLPALVEALEDEESSVRVAALAALARIGDPSVLDAVRGRVRDRNGSVARQARTSVRTLEQIAQRQAAAGGGPSTGGTGATAPGGGARFYIGLGGMGNRAGVRGDEAKALLRRYLEGEIATVPGVVVTPADETPATTTKVLKQKRLTGYWLDGSITKLTRVDGNIRAEISLMVMTNPGRDLRMMLSGAAQVSAGSRLTPALETDLQNQALKGAAAGAVRRLASQLQAGVSTP